MSTITTPDVNIVTSDGQQELTNKTIDLANNNFPDIFNLVYPIGSIYMSVNNVDPSTLFGGTWVSIGAGKTLVGVDPNDSDYNTVEKTGGSKTKILITDNIPSHNHTATSTSTSSSSSSSSFAGNNIYGSFGFNCKTDCYLTVRYVDGCFGYYNETIRSVADYTGTSSGAGRVYFSATPSGTVSTSTSTSTSTTTTIGNTGSGTAFDVKNPYLTCYMWKRTA